MLLAALPALSAFVTPPLSAVANSPVAAFAPVRLAPVRMESEYEKYMKSRSKVEVAATEEAYRSVCSQIDASGARRKFRSP